MPYTIRHGTRWYTEPEAREATPEEVAAQQERLDAYLEGRVKPEFIPNPRLQALIDEEEKAEWEQLMKEAHEELGNG